MKKILSLVMALLLLSGMSISLVSCSDEETGPVPIVCGETGMNDVAGVATYGVDYYSLGVKAGDMAADILLNGAKASEMAVQTDPNPTLSVNEEVANAIGFTIPDAVKNKATAGGSTKVTRVETAIVESGADFKIGILQLLPHVALDQSNTGFIDQLSVRLNAAGKTAQILNQNASGEEANNTTIAENFVAQNVNLIYTIATSSSQAAVSATAETSIPVIFNAVTDPVGAGLVNSMTVPGKNVTGVSDINPVGKQIELIGELLGKDDVKVGFLYTSAETNSVFQVRDLGIPACDALGYTYVDGGITDITELEVAISRLKQEGVDAIYIPTDNTIANGIATVHSFNIGE